MIPYPDEDMREYYRDITVHDIFWVSSSNILPCMICDIILSTEKTFSASDVVIQASQIAHFLPSSQDLFCFTAL